MATRRWHHQPQLSPAVLLIPAVAALVGIWFALSLTTGPDEVIAAFNGTNTLLPSMLTLGGIVLGIGVAIMTAVIIGHRKTTRSQRALRRRFMHSPGWVKRRGDNPNSPRGIKSRLHFLLPHTQAGDITAASVLLGHDPRGKQILITCDESILIIGPPGSGKDRRVAAPLAAQWPGPALITSTKADLASSVYAARAARGPIVVFDPASFGFADSAASSASTHPADTSHRQMQPMRWNPVDGCADKDVAARRAAAIIAGGSANLDEQFWATAGARILRATLHAAALDGGSVLDAGDWAMSVPGWLTASDILTAHGEIEWARALREDADLDPRTSSSITATLTGTLAGLSNTRLRAALTPHAGEAPVDIAAVLAASGTIFAIAPAEADSHLVYRPWTTLLASEVAAVLREQARGTRLEPPALLLLNELVHVCPLPELPGLLADGRGHNITTIAIVQDPAQLAARYSPDQARAITAAAQHRLLLAAGSEDTAKEWSDLIGTYRATSRSRTHKPMGITSTSANVSLEDRPIMPPEELRYIPYGCAILLPRGSAPLPLELQSI